MVGLEGIAIEFSTLSIRYAGDPKSGGGKDDIFKSSGSVALCIRSIAWTSL